MTPEPGSEGHEAFYEVSEEDNPGIRDSLSKGTEVEDVMNIVY